MVGGHPAPHVIKSQPELTDCSIIRRFGSVQSTNRLQERRSELGVSQIQLAAKADISLSQVQNLESGKNTPNLATARRVADALDTTVDALWPKDAESAEGSAA